MESKKINQLATEMTPTGSDLTIIGDPITGVSRKITLLQLSATIGTGADLQGVTDNGATTTNPIAIGGLTITGLATGALLSTSGVISSVPYGAANGVATLGGDGKVPSIQLPSYVDDVVEVANFAALPVTGETGKIYITLDNNKVYRWTGSIYVEVAADAAVWGAITGTLSNQTDLQNALNLKANDNAVVHLAGTETITGAKTFANNVKIDNGVDGNYIGFKQYGTGSTATTGFTTLYSISTNGFGIGFGTTKAIQFDSASITTFRTYIFPDANGTIALTSDIPSLSGYVPYTGATTNVNLGTFDLTADVITGATGSFASSGGSDTFAINHSSGSGIALNITKGGNGEGLYINKTSGSGNAATIIGTLNATTLVKSGGTSSQFLKADGSVDSTSYGTGSVTSVGLSSATSGVTIGSTPITTSGTITLAIATASGSQNGLLSSTDWTTFNGKQAALNGTGFVKISGTTISYDNSTYLTTSAASSTYLPLSGGTLTGALNGTSAVFSGSVTATTFEATDVESGVSANYYSPYSGGSSSILSFLYGSSGSVTWNNGGVKMTLTSAGALQVASSLSATSATLNGSVTINSTAAALSPLQVVATGTIVRLGEQSGTTGKQFLIGIDATSGRSELQSLWQGTGFTSLALQPSGGNVLIGTTTDAGYKLNVAGEISLDSYLRHNGDTDTFFGFSTNDEIKFRTAGTDRLTIASDGNVGIGTSSPSAKLEVSTQDYLRVSRPTSSQYVNIYYAGIECSPTNHFYINAGTGYGTVFNTNGGTERMRITSGGNVGIGTSSPVTNLEVSGRDAILRISDVKSASAIDEVSSSLQFWSSDPSVASGSNASRVRASINTIFENASGSLNSLTFNVNDGTASGLPERMKISSGGSVTIANLAGIGSRAVLADANGVLSAPVSDISVKENITSIGYGLSEILQMNPVWFDFIDEYKNYGEGRQNGMIAQEVAEVIPEAVFVTPSTGKMGINYDQMHGVYIKAIQQLEERIKQLENK
jgi:hypothetical protein